MLSEASTLNDIGYGVVRASAQACCVASIGRGKAIEDRRMFQQRSWLAPEAASGAYTTHVWMLGHVIAVSHFENRISVKFVMMSIPVTSLAR